MWYILYINRNRSFLLLQFYYIQLYLYATQRKNDLTETDMQLSKKSYIIVFNIAEKFWSYYIDEWPQQRII